MKLVCILTFVYAVADCRLLPITKPVPSTKPTIVLPKEFLEQRKKIIADINMPNREFCNEMAHGTDDFNVLPWWYYYCRDLRENDPKAYNGNIHFTSIHKYILNELQAYKKKEKLRQHKMQRLLKELDQ